MAKISIIIPVYNVEKYLDTCVQSVVNQTLKDIEIILVDDESPDSCPHMCDNYAVKDERIKVVHKNNGGLGFARNSGLEVATGKYVTFLDSDDYVDLETYEHLCTLLEKHTLDAIFYKFIRFSDNNDNIQTRVNDDVELYQGESIKKLMLDIIASEPSAKVDHKIQCSSCSAIYRLDIIKKNNIRFHSERELISEDLIFNLDYLSHVDNVGFNFSEHYHYRLNNFSLTSTVRTNRIEKNITLYNYINQNLKNWNLDVDKGSERNNRLFIGYSRSAIVQLLKSSYELKMQWLDNVLSNEIWACLYKIYDWRKLPLYQCLFFLFCCKKCKLGLLILSILR